MLKKKKVEHKNGKQPSKWGWRPVIMFFNNDVQKVCFLSKLRKTNSLVVGKKKKRRKS